MNKRAMVSLKKSGDIVVVYLLFIIVFLIGSVTSTSFISNRNVGNLIEQATTLGIVSIGQSIVMLTAGIDLSAGGTISLTTAILSVTMQDNPSSILLSIVLVLAVGALVGAVNGFGVTKFKLPPFIMTLAMNCVVNGVALLIRPVPGGEIPENFMDGLNNRLAVFPIASIFWILLLVVAYVFLKRTIFGRNIYAVGGNRQTSLLTGINVKRVEFSTYMISGLFSALAGIYLSARIGSGDATIGTQYSMDSVTAAVLAGVSLFGGRGNVAGLLASVFILSSLSNILNLTNVNSFYQYILKGSILILTVLVFTIRDSNHQKKLLTQT